MIILNGKQNDKIQIRRLWDDCFDDDSVKWRDWYFENIFHIENVVGAAQNGELLSMVHMNPYTLMLRGGKIKSYALAGVATKKIQRGQGYAGNLIKYSLKKAYTLGYDLSFLYPFNYEFYEKYGYKLSYDKYKYQQKYYPDNKTPELIILHMFDDEVLAKIYNRFVINTNGYVLRNMDYYNVHIKELITDGGEVICFSVNGSLGYYSINAKENTIDEIAYDGDISTAIKAITGHYQKDLIFENLYDLPDLLGIRQPHCMSRVINVESILKNLTYKNISINIKIKDNIIEENNDVFRINSKDGYAEVSRVKSRPDYKIDIAMLAPIILGYSGIDDEGADEIQKNLFNKTQSFIYEMC